MSRSPARTFYRAVKTYPPTDRDSQSPRQRRGDPPEDFTPEQQRSWDALSAYGTEAGVRRQHRLVPGIGRYVVRYEIPEDAGITWEETIEPGHFDLRGDMDELKRYPTTYWAKL